MKQVIQQQLERNYLGHLLAAGMSKNMDVVYEGITNIENYHLQEEKNQILYSEIVNTIVTRKRLDRVTLFMKLESAGKLELAGGTSYINDLISNKENTTTLPEMIYQLRNEHSRRKLREICNNTIKQLSEESNVEIVINDLDKQVYEIQDGKPADTMVDIPKTVDEILEKTSNVENFGCYGYSFGLPRLDMMTGGLELKKCYVVGASKKSGKSKFVINTIHSLHQQGIKSLFLSMEMSGEGVVKELITRFRQINNYDLKKKLTQDLWEKIKSLPAELTLIEIDTQMFLTLSQMRYKIRQASQRGVKVVFIDYFQRMDFQTKGSSKNHATVLAEATMQIADMAKEFDVAIVFLSQLANRADNEQASIADLKDSGGIGEGVDCILILNNQDRINKVYENKTNEVDILIEQRSGSSGVVHCIVDLGMAKYEELANNG